MAEKILIIDDDVDTLRLVGLMLQKQGYQIIAASNGPQGLTHAEEQVPDLILLDVMMPGMDGYEVARRLRAGATTSHIPILMFTAKSQLDDQLSGFEAGADDYLTKPTHPAELQTHVKDLLARSAGKKNINPATSPLDQSAYAIGVLTPRGGVGGTSVAFNLASALHVRGSADAVMVEMRPGEGTLALDLNVPYEKGMVALLNTPIAELTRQKVRENLHNITPGLKILLASPRPKDAPMANMLNQYEVIHNRLQFISRFTVYDFGTGISAVTEKLAPQCNEIFIVTEPMHYTVAQTKLLMEDLVALGIQAQRIRLVVNYRFRSDVQLSATQVQEKLGVPVAQSFTSAPELFFQALRSQTSAFLMQPDSLTRQQYTVIANQILDRAPKAASKP